MRRSLTLLLLGLSASPALAADPALFVYKGAGCDGRDRLPRFESVMGVKVEGVVDFVSQENWSEFTKESNWAADCWSKTPLRLAMSVPMIEKGEKGFADGLAGKHDAAFTQLGKVLVAKGKADALLRIGWEFNGNWYPWKVEQDPVGFRAYFRHIVGVFRAVPGQHFRIVWNPSMATGSTKPDDAWPGDDVVDAVGLDVYNQSWKPLNTAESRWAANLSADYGLDWLAAFAKAHHKPIVIPEWGTGTRSDGHGGGDDPLFVKRMIDWMRAHDVKFAGYWDFNASDYNAQLSTGLFPQSAAVFTRAFGQH